MQQKTYMLPRSSPVDDYESEVPTAPNPDTDRDPTLGRRLGHIPTPPRSSTRALYVPSHLPMCELKKAMARADEEATHNSSPPIAMREESPPSSAPTRLHGHQENRREPTPFELAKTSLAHSLDEAQARRLSSNVDAQEANAGWRYPIPPLPALDEFAPIVGAYDGAPGALPVPGVAFAATTNSEAPQAKRGGARVAASIVMSLLVAVVAIGVAHGDLTREDARDAAAVVQRVAQNVVANVKRL